jgi:hypothetical protein
MMRFLEVLHGLALALLTGGIAGVGLAVGVLFQRAPSREIAGQVGNATFSRLGPAVLALAAIVLAARVYLHRAEPPSGIRTTSLVLAVAIVAVAALVALGITPRMAALWAAGAHAADGSGLTGEDRGRFVALHALANAAYLVLLACGAALIVLTSIRRAAG